MVVTKAPVSAWNCGWYPTLYIRSNLLCTSSVAKFDLFMDLSKTSIHNEMGFVNLQSYLNMPLSLSQNTLLDHTHLSSWEGRRTTRAHLKKGSGGWWVKQLLRSVLDFYIKVTGTQACNLESVG